MVTVLAVMRIAYFLSPFQYGCFYRQVYKAREIRTGEIVALKRIRMDDEKEGFPITANRELKLLKKLHHENIIKLKEIVTSAGPEKNGQENQDSKKLEGGIYMVFEYMDHDLTGLADCPGVRFSIPQIKCYMKQLLTRLHYCHINQVLYRDMKGSNLLLDNEGKLKLADFGLAKSFATNHQGQLTNRVIALWYRYDRLHNYHATGKPSIPGFHQFSRCFSVLGFHQSNVCACFFNFGEKDGQSRELWGFINLSFGLKFEHNSGFDFLLLRIYGFDLRLEFK